MATATATAPARDRQDSGLLVPGSAGRRFRNNLATVLVYSCFLIALVPLVWILWTVVSRGSGLITDPRSPWHGVSACTGRPGCAKSLSDVRADAAAWLSGPELSDPLEMIGMGTRSPQGALQSGSIPQRPVHWSGCSRRCGRPAGDVIEFVATGDGYCRIAGTAGDEETR